jgi:FlaA1/EpsC-like NDP-sugar epimerase
MADTQSHGIYRVLNNPHLRQSVKIALDGALAVLAWKASVALWQGGLIVPFGARKWLSMALIVNLTFRFTRMHYRMLGFRDALQITWGTLVLAAGSFFFYQLEPVIKLGATQLSVVLGAALLTGSFWILIRALVLAVHERKDIRLPEWPKEDRRRIQRTLIIGAGRAGLLVAQEFRRHPELGCVAVGFLDDAIEKQGVRIQGIPVFGHSMLLGAIIKEQRIDQVVLAMPSAPGQVVRSIAEEVQRGGVRLKTVPGIFNILASANWKPELRDVSIEDLLRREPIHLDQSAIQRAIEGKVVLITGAGGSIGSELVRQIALFRPGRLVLLGRGENSLWEIEREIKRLHTGLTISLELCDIRNATRLNRAFQNWKPEVVLHAAAHKHVPFLELNPEEGIENNALGTGNVVEACRKSGTRIFVNISTDKAVNPTNVLGATTRIAEALVRQAGAEAGEKCKFVSVRFGNVLGSRGSVIPVFKEQIRGGGPVTVTHPEMTRYFMTIPEAAQLVLQAGLLGENGKVYLLDMGEPVKIVDLAKDMCRLSGLTPGVDIEIQFSGIRPGEKLYEELFTDSEEKETNVHPKVFESGQEPLDVDLLKRGIKALQAATQLPEGPRQREILNWFGQLVPTYTPSPLGLGIYADVEYLPDRSTPQAPMATGGVIQ